MNATAIQTTLAHGVMSAGDIHRHAVEAGNPAGALILFLRWIPSPDKSGGIRFFSAAEQAKRLIRNFISGISD